MMISIKSIVRPAASKTILDTQNWIYAGDDKRLFNILKKKLPNSKGFSMSQIEGDNMSQEIIFFDSKSLKYGEIVREMSQPYLDSLRKRIIAQDHSFYLGSDSSNKRGEVVQL